MELHIASVVHILPYPALKKYPIVEKYITALCETSVVPRHILLPIEWYVSK